MLVLAGFSKVDGSRFCLRLSQTKNRLDLMKIPVGLLFGYDGRRLLMAPIDKWLERCANRLTEFSEGYDSSLQKWNEICIIYLVR